MAKKKVATEKVVEIPALKIERRTIKIVAYAPGDELICHAWSEKAKKEMLDKQLKKAKQGRAAKDPEQDYRDSLYWLSKKPPHERIAVQKVDPSKHELFGFKTIAFKAAAVRAANDVGIQMTVARRAFHVPGEFVVLKFDHVYVREDMVRLNGGVADIRYRGAFVDWSVELPVELNVAVWNWEQLLNLFNTAGFGVGVGEWRPERNGVAGRFRVA